ncbi:MAG: helix-turn-helix domain-containing protein [Planctomycetota bacterium]|jgi:AraC-like DNA-binding protein
MSNEKRRRISPDPRWLDMPLVREWGWVRSRSSGPLAMHTNAGYEITYSDAGEYTWVLEGGKRLVLRGGQLCLTQPQVPHRGEDDLIAPGRLFFLVFDPRAKSAARHTPFTEECLRYIETTLTQAGNVVFGAGQGFQSLVHQVRDVMEAVGRGDPDPLLRSRAQALVAQVVMGVVHSLTHPVSVQESSPIHLARRFMEEHLHESFGMEEVARQVGLNRSRFYEQFGLETGVTPSDYLSRLRCSRAARALRETEESVTTIAHAHGFATSQYFATCFRRYTGMSPREYRRKGG